MKTPIGTTSHNDLLGVVDRFVIDSITDRSIFSDDKKEMKFTPKGLKHLRASVGDIFYMFQGGLVGVVSPSYLEDAAQTNENARFLNGLIEGRRRGIRGQFYVRAIYEKDTHYWIAAFPFTALNGL